jgi:hypothetical protein
MPICSFTAISSINFISLIFAGSKFRVSGHRGKSKITNLFVWYLLFLNNFTVLTEAMIKKYSSHTKYCANFTFDSNGHWKGHFNSFLLRIQWKLKNLKFTLVPAQIGELHNHRISEYNWKKSKLSWSHFGIYGAKTNLTQSVLTFIHFKLVLAFPLLETYENVCWFFDLSGYIKRSSSNASVTTAVSFCDNWLPSNSGRLSIFVILIWRWLQTPICTESLPGRPLKTRDIRMLAHLQQKAKAIELMCKILASILAIKHTPRAPRNV